MLFMACYKVGFWQVFAEVLIKNHLRTQDNHYKPAQKLQQAALFIFLTLSDETIEIV